MSPTNHTMPTTERLASARVIVHQASHSAAQMAQARRDNDAVLAPVRRTSAAAVMADMESATGKPRHTSDDTRRAETERRRALTIAAHTGWCVSQPVCNACAVHNSHR